MYYADDFFEPKPFDINVFISELGDIDNVNSFEILDKLSLFSSDNKKVILNNEIIKEKLRYGLLLESSNNQWHYYRKVLNVITSGEFLSLYDFDFLYNYFKERKTENLSVFFAALCEKNINEVVYYVLNERMLYEEFFRLSDNFSSYFNELDYSLLVDVILKKQNAGYDLSFYFLGSVKEEYQYKILSDPLINDESLVFLLSNFSNKVKSYFFENDLRALYLYNRFDVKYLLKSGIKFNDNILKKNEFFELLKSESFIEFRNNINSAEKCNNPIFIEDKLEKYYDEIISSYDIEKGIFKDYEFILLNPGNGLDSSYMFDFDTVWKISNYLIKLDNGHFYYENKDALVSFLQKETSMKLSEVIIDAIFRDNIYNVWLNINEMLRYNNTLDEKSKILDKNKIDFYKMILNFDNIDNLCKIELYNKLKNKNFNYTFYNDIRTIKDYCYDKIKNNLFNTDNCLEYLDKNSSLKYGITVYDLRDKEYDMLVRTQAKFRDNVQYRRGCYSIISNENTQVFGEYDTDSFVYGYNSFDNDVVIHMFERDSYSTNFRDTPSRYVNRIMSSEQLVKGSSSYNEIQLLNKKNNSGKYKWDAKTPDFIVVYDIVSDKHINESRRLGIPIVIIRRKKLEKKDIIDVNFDNDVDAYVSDLYSEREHRIRR